MNPDIGLSLIVARDVADAHPVFSFLLGLLVMKLVVMVLDALIPLRLLALAVILVGVVTFGGVW